MKKLFKDIVFFYEGNNRWLIYNVFNRQNIMVEHTGLEIYSKLLEEKEINYKEVNIWDSYKFSNTDGLLNDPTCLERDQKKLKKKRIKTGDFRKILLEKNLLIKSFKIYESKFKKKDNLLDFKNFGNFHQQLGQNLLKPRTKNFDLWWLNQKFEKNKSKIKANLYQFVQENFLRNYFKKKIKKNMKILDVGCGIGYFTDLIKKISNNVIGIDPNDLFIKEAQNKFKANFLKLDIGKKNSLKTFTDNSFDFIFMSDALLFYFYQVIEDPKIKLEFLLNDLRRILKKGGSFVSVEPNYNNWLLPWFGSSNRPFTTITEYEKKNYRVTPTQFQLLKELINGGFSIVNLEEIYPTNYKKLSRDLEFAKKFPQWQLIECRKF
tara:strand:- start:34286 stop:35416 length:1131 start_codon:yes stop_codon:yes gene_type:complete